MVMPDEFTLQLDEFDLLAVELPNDFGIPMVGEALEFLGNVDDCACAHDAFFCRCTGSINSPSANQRWWEFLLSLENGGCCWQQLELLLFLW